MRGRPLATNGAAARHLTLALVVVLAGISAGCAETALSNGDGIPVLLVTGTIVESHTGNGDQQSPVCSYDPPYRGDPRLGRIELRSPEALEGAVAVAIFAASVETADESLCGPGMGLVVVSADEPSEVSAKENGVPIVGVLSIVDMKRLRLDAVELREGDSTSVTTSGIRRSGFEGGFAYQANLTATHAGCWVIQDGSRWIRGTC